MNIRELSREKPFFAWKSPRASLQSRRGRRGPELEILHKHVERSEGPLPREQLPRSFKLFFPSSCS